MPARTRRKVTTQECREAVAGIRSRRLKTDTVSQLEGFSDDPAEAVDYVLKHRSVDAQILKADVLDALTLQEHARLTVAAAILDRAEHQLLILGQQLGLTLNQMGDKLGISKVAVKYRIDRYKSFLHGGIRSEVVWRQTQGASAEHAWIGRHAVEVAALVMALPDHRHQLRVSVETAELHGSAASALVDLTGGPDDDLDSLADAARALQSDSYPLGDTTVLLAEAQFVLTRVTAIPGAVETRQHLSRLTRALNAWTTTKNA